MPEKTPGDLPLATLDQETGQPPESRITDAETAKLHVDNLARANEDRSKIDKQLFGLVSGFPPFNRGTRLKNAQLHLCNVNWRIGESMFLNALTPYHDVIANAPFYCMVRTEEGNEKQEDWSDIITQEFQRLNEKDSALRPMFDLSQHDMVLYRYGPVVWQDQFDFRAKAVPQSNFLVPDRTKSDVNEWTECVIRTTMNVSDLYATVLNPAATKRGWNIELAKTAITYAVPETMWDTQNRYNWTYYASKIRNNDVYYSTVSESVPVAWLYWRELPNDTDKVGKISMAAIVETEFLSGRGAELRRERYKKDPGNKGFLFRAERVFDTWQQAINPFYFNRGDGTHHSVKALGIMLLGPMETYNRFSCHIVDAAEFASKIGFRALTDTAAQGLAVQNYGGWMVFPPGLEYLPMPNQGANLEQPMAVKMDILRTLTSNLSQYRAQVEQKPGNPVTAKEITYRMMSETVISQSTMNIYFEQLDEFWAERYRRVVNPKLTAAHAGGEMVMEFRRRCLDRGVPESALRKVEYVRAVRTIGSGSAVARTESLTRMFSRIGMYSEAGRQKILEDVTADDVGQALMRRYCPPANLTPAQQDQQAEARQWIACMMVGVPPQVTPTQDAMIYAGTFLKAAMDSANSLAQGAQPEKVYAFLEIAGPAIQAHLQRMVMDPTRADLVKQWQSQWEQLAAVHDKLKATIQQNAQRRQQMMAQLQQRQQQMVSNESIATQESQSAIARKDREAQARMTLKEQQTEQKLQLADKTTASKIIQQQRLNAIKEKAGNE